MVKFIYYLKISYGYLRKNRIIDFFQIYGGETEIRTLEGVATLPVFKTGAFNRSAISPIKDLL